MNTKLNNNLFQIPAVVADLPYLVSGINVSQVSDDICLRDLLRAVRTAQRCLDGLAMKIVGRADQLALEGNSASGFDISLDLGQVSGNQARAEAKRAETVALVPGLLEAVVSGDSSSSHVDSVSRHINKLSDEQRTQLDQKEISSAATKMPVDTFNRHMKRIVDKSRNDHGLKDLIQMREASEFKHWYDNKTGMGKFCGQLDPVRYEAFTAAIDAHTSTLAKTSENPTVKNPNLALSALFELATSSRNTQQRLPHITVIVDQQTLATGYHDDSVHQTNMGTELPPEAVTRLCCDSVLQKVVDEENNIPINVGRKYRTATDAQWITIKSIYNTCAWQ